MNTLGLPSSAGPSFLGAADEEQGRKTVKEIEVTPEMIEAGGNIIALRWAEIVEPQSPTLYQEVAAMIYRAMHEKLSRSQF